MPASQLLFFSPFALFNFSIVSIVPIVPITPNSTNTPLPMKKLLLLFPLLCLFSMAVFAEGNPVADPDAVVVSGKMRFTVLTPQMIRIQYSPTAHFEDRATFTVVNRRLPVPEFTSTTRDGYLTIQTSALTLRYKEGTRPIPAQKSSTNLSITFTLGGQEVVWYPGKDDALNLRGTQRTLDNVAGDTQRDRLEQGILSCSGWAVIDESPAATRGDGSRSFPMEPKEQGGMDWVAQPLDAQAYDWYFLGYGHDYTAALGDFVKVAGRIPLPPAYLFGYWYSRYWAYSQSEFMQIVNDIERNKIPLDVMIFDMDWHTAGWTGWTWNKKLIPDPKGLINWMHKHGLRVALNLHPADGIDNDEEYYDVLSRDLGRDPAKGETIPWELEDYDFYKAMFKDIIRAREAEGVDFWWLDWQQWLINKQIDGLGQTFWHNHVFFEDMRLNRPDRRPTIYHRWGGLGSHRYQIGFSGDTYATWPTLAYQPYFTATASNVGYGYWGHDLGGHQQQGDNNPELYLRWMQYGVFSPIFRTHATNASNIERRIWKFPNFPQLRETVILRYALFPYIYTAARETYDTGVGICRPLYYQWPEIPEAYRYEDEYLFGPDILVAPVTSPVDDEGLARRTTWLPDGLWYDVAAAELVRGGVTFNDGYTLDQIPYFYRAGSIIPLNPAQNTVMLRPSSNILRVVPGADGTGTLYEDAFDTDGYKQGEYTFTRVSQTRTADAVEVCIAAREGAFDGMPDSRSYTFELLGMAAAPTAVFLDGKAVSDSSFSYDEAAHVITVTLSDIPCTSSVTLRVEAPSLSPVSREPLTLADTYEPYVDATATTGYWVTGSAIPGGTQQLEPYPDGTYRFHGTLSAGSFRIMNTATATSATRYTAPRYADVSIVGSSPSKSMTASAAAKENAEWNVPFTESRYRFTLNPSKQTLEGELFIPWGELYIAGGCIAAGQADKWHVEMAKPFTRSATNPHVWTWTGELRAYAGNEQANRFKLLAQKDWGPRSLHPYKQDEPLVGSTRASQLDGDHKWTIGDDGWYRITVDVFRETIDATYLGKDFDPSSVAAQPAAQQGSLSDKGFYSLLGTSVPNPSAKGIYITQGRKYLVR